MNASLVRLTAEPDELAELKDLVEDRMEDLREEGVTALRDRFTEEAAAFGVIMEEVFGITERKPGRPRKVDSDAVVAEVRALSCLLQSSGSARDGC